MGACEIVQAARVLARHRLVTAFGHVSERLDSRSALLTPPRALGVLSETDAMVTLDLEAPELPAGAPGEAWMHWAIYRSRPDVRAICRGQPPSSHPLGALGGPIRPIHGQGAWVSGALAVFDDARLVRTRAAGERLAECLADQDTIILRGNGALAVGASVAEAATRLWLLEVSARYILQACSAGTPQALSDQEIAAWRLAAPELMARLWEHLSTQEE
jgi:HCOMODA/2-hydroxy-3-carboxy-muconic semialdehyde decarboxylase